MSRKQAVPVAPKGAVKAWKLSLARAARDVADLELGLTDIRQDRLSLAELLDLPPERALIVILEGPKEHLGLIVFSPEVLAGIVEMQTVGRVNTAPSLSRKPTRTDAAMTSGLIDAALTGLEVDLMRDADLVWTSGFRYASFLEDARPLGLLLEDATYQTIRANIELADGARTGQIILALPADGRGKQPEATDAPPNKAAEMVFAAALGEQVMGANAELVAVLARIKLPIDAVLNLKAGDPVLLGKAAIDQIDIEGTDGMRAAGGKLGQNRGMRAVRLLEAAQPAARVSAPGARAQVATTPPERQKAG